MRTLGEVVFVTDPTRGCALPPALHPGSLPYPVQHLLSPAEQRLRASSRLQPSLCLMQLTCPHCLSASWAQPCSRLCADAGKQMSPTPSLPMGTLDMGRDPLAGDHRTVWESLFLLLMTNIYWPFNTCPALFRALSGDEQGTVGAKMSRGGDIFAAWSTGWAWTSANKQKDMSILGIFASVMGENDTSSLWSPFLCKWGCTSFCVVCRPFVFFSALPHLVNEIYLFLSCSCFFLTNL